MKVAAVQLNAVFADVDRNLRQAAESIEQGAREKAGLVLLPEFFPSAMGFSDRMLDVPLQGRRVRAFLCQQAARHNVIVGGSYLNFDGEHSCNLFDLAFPDGGVYSHKKDLPTQFENCYYTVGDEAHVLDTPMGKIGVALCWELIRCDTLRRIAGQVDFVLAGSCWWDLPLDAKPGREPLRQYNQALALKAPAVFAKLLRAPVIHANHCGTVTAYSFPAANRLQTRQLVGATQIVDAEGGPVARKLFSEGAGLVLAELPTRSPGRSAITVGERYWIPDLPEEYLTAWDTLGSAGRKYYQEVALPYYHRRGADQEIAVSHDRGGSR